MADRRPRRRAFAVEKSGMVAVHFGRGLPGWAEPQELLAAGGGYVLIHHVNANDRPERRGAMDFRMRTGRATPRPLQADWAQMS